MAEMETKDRIVKYLGQLAPHVRAREAAVLLDASVTEIDRLNADREALMRRLFLAGEVFAEIEAHPDRAERLASGALFGLDAEPLPNGQLQGPGGSLPGPAASDS